VLVATLSHFPKLKIELGLLRSGRNAKLIEDEADALWAWVNAASDSLALNIPSTIAHGSPDDVRE
jgi:hypothetical protein